MRSGDLQPEHRPVSLHQLCGGDLQPCRPVSLHQLCGGDLQPEHRQFLVSGLHQLCGGDLQPCRPGSLHQLSCRHIPAVQRPVLLPGVPPRHLVLCRLVPVRRLPRRHVQQPHELRVPALPAGHLLHLRRQLRAVPLGHIRQHHGRPAADNYSTSSLTTNSLFFSAAAAATRAPPSAVRAPRATSPSPPAAAAACAPPD